MFTGLIEAVGPVRAVEPGAGGRRLVIEVPWASALSLGESVACSGVCLTVVAVEGALVSFDVGPQTLAVTSIGTWRVGTVVNLERALRFGDRLGGHVVQGHVDTSGRIDRIEHHDEFHRVSVRYPAEFARFLILRGSIAVDGISLTVADLGPDTFEVQIVPHTWRATTLSTSPVGTAVNLEFDMVGKYVLRSADLGDGGPSGAAL